MSGLGHVVIVNTSPSKQGTPAWEVITDYDPGPRPDGLKPCAVWIPLSGPSPAIGEVFEWGPHHAWWGDPVVKVGKIDNEFDPADPHLWTG